VVDHHAGPARRHPGGVQVDVDPTKPGHLAPSASNRFSKAALALAPLLALGAILVALDARNVNLDPIVIFTLLSISLGISAVLSGSDTITYRSLVRWLI
jgi:hypothetical protein